MPDSFTLTIPTKKGDLTLEAELRVFGYTHKISVWVEGIEFLFEPDEERNYRAVLADPQLQSHRIDRSLIEAIAQEIRALLVD